MIQDEQFWRDELYRERPATPRDYQKLARAYVRDLDRRMEERTIRMARYNAALQGRLHA